MLIPTAPQFKFNGTLTNKTNAAESLRRDTARAEGGQLGQRQGGPEGLGRRKNPALHGGRRVLVSHGISLS